MSPLRAFSANLRALTVHPAERQRLETLGILNPTVQRYLVWRRSIFLVVILFTLASAALATCNEAGLFDPASPVADASAADSPVPNKSANEADGNETDDSQADEEDEEEEQEGAAENPLVKSAEQALATAMPPAEEEPKANAFSKFADLVHLVALYSVPLAAFGALLFWTRVRLTHRIMLAGWAIGSLAPMLIALCPWSWWGYDMTPDPDATDLEKLRDAAESAKDAAEYLVTLLPIVLSMLPGAQRACLRVKTLLPESILPGWLIVSSAPLQCLMFMVLFVVVNQVADNPLFLGGMLCLLAAPMTYLVRADVLTRPLVTEADHRGLARVRMTMSALSLTGGALLVTFAMTQSVFDMHLVGRDDNAMLYPMDIPVLLLEGFGRSLFITVLGADLFLRMNLSAWRHGKALAGTEAERGYDEVLDSLDRDWRRA